LSFRDGHTAHTRFQTVRLRLESLPAASGWKGWLTEFALFGFKQGWACLFGALMLSLLLGTHLCYPRDAALARYDFLTLAAAGIQVCMLLLRLETLEEAKVIVVFHAIGTVMELFKTAAGSWTYPEASVLRLGEVPLFSGFMYAAVGSYIARVWRIFDFRFSAYPPRLGTWLVGLGVYINFFAHHWLPDVRLALFAGIVLLFRKTRVWFRVWHDDRWMPLLVGWLLVATFIWFAENIATFSRAWIYPSQANGWSMVHPAKLGAWYLLMYISFILVAAVHRPQEKA